MKNLEPTEVKTRPVLAQDPEKKWPADTDRSLVAWLKDRPNYSRDWIVDPEYIAEPQTFISRPAELTDRDLLTLSKMPGNYARSGYTVTITPENDRLKISITNEPKTIWEQ
ncbi:hypothetical protein ACT3TD_14595 [Corynebacterium sp. AOP36-E1-14]|uniref:hypothetical protein n=1 Tax=unclassified Corynebacterium TaxID=2624378 RepID=UPI004033DCF7